MPRPVDAGLDEIHADQPVSQNPLVGDENKCVHCVACVSICPTGTFRFEDWKVVAESGKCIQCGACVVGCPQRSLRLVLR